MKKLFILIIGIIFVYSCETEEIKTFQGDRFLQFTNSVEKDSTVLSFMFHPGKTSVKIPLEVTLIGKPVTKDLNYKLEVFDALTTAPSKNFSIPNNLVFEAGKVVDTVEIELIKSPELKTEEVLLIVKISDNENFTSGANEYKYAKLWISDKLTKPQWWDNQIEWYWLGEYSEKKFKTFMDVTGVGDLTDMDASERRKYCIQFKYYLIEMKEKETPVLEENGAEMEVPIIG